jgi:hypothetical protein
MHGYIYRGLSGWSVCWMWGPNEYRFRHSFATWDEALGALKRDWDEKD